MTTTETVESISSMVSKSEISSPISRFLPYITASLHGLWRALSFTFSFFSPLRNLSPVPILLYVLAPLLVFLNIVATAFIVSPYRMAVYLFDALFPVYVFCGVACITGGLLGVTARVLCHIVVNLLQVDNEFSGSPKRPDSSASRILNDNEITEADVKRRGRNSEKVKFET